MEGGDGQEQGLAVAALPYWNCGSQQSIISHHDPHYVVTTLRAHGTRVMTSL